MKNKTYEYILATLKRYLKDNPMVRLGQALVNLDIVPHPGKEGPEYTVYDLLNEDDKAILKRLRHTGASKLPVDMVQVGVMLINGQSLKKIAKVIYKDFCPGAGKRLAKRIKRWSKKYPDFVNAHMNT